MQPAIKPEYIVDDKGKRKKVILSYEQYQNMLELIEDIEDSKLIAKTVNEPEISFDDYKRKRKIV